MGLVIIFTFVGRGLGLQRHLNEQHSVGFADVPVGCRKTGALATGACQVRSPLCRVRGG